MILFVFEGKEREPFLYKTLERLYMQKGNDNIICTFNNNIYELYSEIESLDDDGDIVSMLRERLANRGDSTLDGIKTSDISETYLFFDYDFQHSQLPLEEINLRVKSMLELFTDETGNGKLYINYPMIESIRYTKELPDENYVNYVVSRADCRDFKRLAAEFSYYDNFDYILFEDGEVPTKEKYLMIKDNWEYLTQMNVCKANFIISGNNEMPNQKDDINQLRLFASQKEKYVDISECVAVLNSFPLFLYEYLK